MERGIGPQRRNKMSMSGPGMWMPKQKSGKNWEMSYKFSYADGDIEQGVMKFRIKSDASDWKKRMNNEAFGTKHMQGKVLSLEFGKVEAI